MQDSLMALSPGSIYVLDNQGHWCHPVVPYRQAADIVATFQHIKYFFSFMFFHVHGLTFLFFPPVPVALTDFIFPS